MLESKISKILLTFWDLFYICDFGKFCQKFSLKYVIFVVTCFQIQFIDHERLWAIAKINKYKCKNILVKKYIHTAFK